MSIISKGRKYECMGGPLCGTRVPAHADDGMYTVDDHGRPHFYRLIRVIRPPNEVATYYHYFGSNRAVAENAHPTLRPHERMFRARKRK